MTMITVTRLLVNPLAQRLARVHLHFLWQGIVALIVAFVASRDLAEGLGRRALSVAGYPTRGAGSLPRGDLRAHLRRS